MNKSLEITDENGRRYSSLSAMCRERDLNYFAVRKRMITNVDKSLLFAQQNLHNIPCKDHLGNEFPTKKAMCAHWGINAVTFSSRWNNGWTLEEALTAPTKTIRKKRRNFK